MMMQSLLYLAIALVILIAIFLLGPKVAIDTRLESIALPDDLDHYLEQSEAKYKDIRPDNQKTIIWANSFQRKSTRYSLIYLHGYSASRQEVYPLVENLGEKLNANVYLTRLTGHGRTSAAMADITVNALLKDAEEALEIGKRIGHKVIVVGLSTGATLATWLAHHSNTDAIHALILMSPNYALRNKKSELLLLPWARHFIPLIEGSVYRFTPDNDTQAKHWTWEYPTSALFPMMGLVKFVRELPVENITLPLLFLISDQDQVVNTDTSSEVYQRFGSIPKKHTVIKGTQGSQHHVLAGESLSPATTADVENQILNFLDQIEIRDGEKK